MTQNKDAPYLKSHASKDNKMLMFIQYILHSCKKVEYDCARNIERKKRNLP